MSTATFRTSRVEQHTAPHGSVRADLDEESREWLRDLRSDGAVKDQALARLHALLLRAARFEVAPAASGAARTCAATSSTTSRSRPPTTP